MIAHALTRKKTFPSNKSTRSLLLPRGYRGGKGKCPSCGSRHVMAVLLTASADERDPDIKCKKCNFRW